MIRLIVLDVDGCMTDGKIIYTHDGVELKNFHVKDGFAIVNWIKLGHDVAIITGRDSQIVKNRAHELKIRHLYQGIKDKEKVLKELVSSLGLSFEEVACIGDDLNDINMLNLVTHSFTPSDGVKEVQEVVKTVLSKKGGDGAVREMIDILIDTNNQKQELMQIWVKNP